MTRVRAIGSNQLLKIDNDLITGFFTDANNPGRLIIETQSRNLHIFDGSGVSTTTPTSRAFVPNSILFDTNVTYDPVYVQTGAITLARALSGNINGTTQVLKITTNGDTITVGAEFNDFGKGIFAFMEANPDTYEVMFFNYQSGTVNEVWVASPRAVSTTTPTTPFDIAGLWDGVYEATASDQFTFHSGVNAATWINKSTTPSAIANMAVTLEANSPTYLDADNTVNFNGVDQTFDLLDAGLSSPLYIAGVLNGFIDLPTRNTIGQACTATTAGIRNLNWGNHTGAYANESFGVGGTNPTGIDNTPSTTPLFNYFTMRFENGNNVQVTLNGVDGNQVSPSSSLTGYQAAFQLGFTSGFNEWFTGKVKGWYVKLGDLTAQELADTQTYLATLV